MKTLRLTDFTTGDPCIIAPNAIIAVNPDGREMGSWVTITGRNKFHVKETVDDIDQMLAIVLNQEENDV